MGGKVSTAMKRLMGLEQECRILMVGLDAAGKTTVLYKMKLGEVVTTIPTIGFNVETVEQAGVSFTVWDVGGRDKIRPLYRHYYQNTDAIIFVVDANDRDRVTEAAAEFWRLLYEDEIRNAHVLVLANKRDIPGAMTAAEVAEAMGVVPESPSERAERSARAAAGKAGRPDDDAEAEFAAAARRNVELGGGYMNTWGDADAADEASARVERAKVPVGTQVRIVNACATTGDGLFEGIEWLSGAVRGDAREGVWIDGVNDAPFLGTHGGAAGASPGEGSRRTAIDLAAMHPNERVIAGATPGETKAFDAAPGLESSKLGADDAAKRALHADAMNALSDDDFVAAVLAGPSNPRNFRHAGHLRLAFALLSRASKDRATTAGRRPAVNKIFECLDAHYARNSLVPSRTVFYFWIQLVDLALHRPLGEAEAERGEAVAQIVRERSETRDSADMLAFREFLARGNLWLLDASLIGDYYSSERIIRDPESLSEFMLPDKKPLPSILSFNVTPVVAS